MIRLVLTFIFTLSATLFILPACSQAINLWQPNTFTDDLYKPNCRDCYVQKVEVMVPKTGSMTDGTDPICSVPTVVDFFEITAAVLRNKIDPNTSGNLSEVAKHIAYLEVRKKVGVTFQAFLDEKGSRSPFENCAPLGALLPRDAVLEEIYLSDWDDKAGPGECIPNKDCRNGGAKFLNTPEIIKPADGGQIVSVAFQNWSHERDRLARMFVSYHMPIGKKVISIELLR
ncbi:MAG: hypothetical protein ACHQYP_10705 [Nitrospiria bacterium]